MIVGNTIGNVGSPQSYEIIGPDGTTLLAVATPDGDEAVLTATSHEILEGYVAATSNGIVTGDRFAADYRTTVGTRIITAGKAYTIPLSQHDKYDYTKFQCIVTAYNTSGVDSVAAEKVVIDDAVYCVGSVEKIADVTKNASTKSIDLNIQIDSTNRHILRYTTYKTEDLP